MDNFDFQGKRRESYETSAKIVAGAGLLLIVIGVICLLLA